MKKKSYQARSLISLIISTCFYSSFSIANPAVESITYDKDTNKLTIKGSGFGEGPEVVLFDDFDSSNLSNGDEISVTGATIGAWDFANPNYPPVLDGRSHSGNLSFLSYDQDKRVMRQLGKNFSKGVQSVFMSYWVSVPEGTFFPGATTTSLRKFSDDSSWKFSWLIDSDYKGNSSDLCAPTHSGYGKFSLGGNDYNAMNINGNSWWSWDHWNRFSISLMANEENPTFPGLIEFRAFSKDKGSFTYRENAPVFDEDGPATKQYQKVNFPGWIRPSGENLVATLYDDIYIAVGDNALKRIEISDSIMFDESAESAIQLVTSWSDTKLVFSPRNGGLSSLNNMSIHFFDEEGIPVLLGELSTDKAAAKPPVFNM